MNANKEATAADKRLVYGVPVGSVVSVELMRFCFPDIDATQKLIEITVPASTQGLSDMRPRVFTLAPQGWKRTYR